MANAKSPCEEIRSGFFLCLFASRRSIERPAFFVGNRMFVELIAGLIVGLITGALGAYAFTKPKTPEIYLDAERVSKSILRAMEVELVIDEPENDNFDRASKEDFMDWWSMSVEQKRGAMTLACSIEKEFAQHCETLGITHPNVAVIGRWVRCIQPRVKTSRRANQTIYHNVQIKAQALQLAA